MEQLVAGEACIGSKRRQNAEIESGKTKGRSRPRQTSKAQKSEGNIMEQESEKLDPIPLDTFVSKLRQFAMDARNRMPLEVVVGFESGKKIRFQKFDLLYFE